MFEISFVHQVICMVADGASSNRKFFAYHAIQEYKKTGLTYKAPNLTLPGRFVYFMVDIPHLMKTTRNAWSNSQARGTRHLEVTIHVHLTYGEFNICRTMGRKSSGHI